MFGFLSAPSDSKLSDLKSSDAKLDARTVHFVRTTLASMVGSAGRGKRSKGNKNGAHGPEWGPVLGSNHFTFNSTGVFSFTNRLANQAGVVASAGGIISQAIALNPSVPTNWSQQSSIFDNYRINAVRFSLIPRQSLTNTDVLLAIAIDDDMTAATAPSSIDTLMQYGTVWFGSTRAPPGSSANGAMVKPYTYTCAKPKLATEPSAISGTVVLDSLGAWSDIAGVSSGTAGFILLRADGCTASQTYFDYVLEYEMQFRQTR